MKLTFASVVLALAFAASAHAQAPYDLVIKSGHVIDPKNGIDGVRDVAIKDGRIAAVRADISPSQATKTVNAAGLGMKDFANVMSKFLALGMPLKDVVLRSTWYPSKVIKREDLGHLTVGAPADVAILRLEKGKFGFLDQSGGRLNGAAGLRAS